MTDHPQLFGTPAFLGRATGVALVMDSTYGLMSLKEPDLGNLKRILVIPSIHKYPEDWLGDHLDGVVTEQGDLISMAAIFARNVGIPAVCGIDSVTNAIADGQLVTLDGTAGTVIISE